MRRIPSRKQLYLTAVQLQVKTFVLYLCTVVMIKKCSSGKCRCFSRFWQQGLNFAKLSLLGRCTYSHSYCSEAPNTRVKYVAHRFLLFRIKSIIKETVLSLFLVIGSSSEISGVIAR